MKKFLEILVLAGMFTGAQAQKEAAWAENTFFWSAGVGGAFYQHSGTSQMGIPAGGLYLGRWLMKPLAFRVAAEMVSGSSTFSA